MDNKKPSVGVRNSNRRNHLSKNLCAAETNPY